MVRQWGVIAFAEAEWNSLVVHGRGDFVLKEKMRLFQDRLKWLNYNVFVKIDLEIEEWVREMNSIDDLVLSDEDHKVEMKKACNKFWLNLKIK